jgi:hypothetical protein
MCVACIAGKSGVVYAICRFVLQLVSTEKSQDAEVHFGASAEWSKPYRGGDDWIVTLYLFTRLYPSFSLSPMCSVQPGISIARIRKSHTLTVAA